MSSPNSSTSSSTNTNENSFEVNLEKRYYLREDFLVPRLRQFFRLSNIAIRLILFDFYKHI